MSKNSGDKIVSTRKARTVAQIKVSERRWFFKARALAEALDAVAGVGASVRVLDDFDKTERPLIKKGRRAK